MRILLWQESFWPDIGGAEVMATKLLRGLGERGHEFIVVTRRDSADRAAEDQYETIPVFRFPFWTALTERNLDRLMEVRLQVAKLKRAFAPDVVHVNLLGPSGFFHLDTANAHPAPSLLTLHGESIFISRGWPRSFLGSADWVVGCSAASLEFGRRLAPEMTVRSSIIYNGIEPPALPPDPLPFDAPRLLCLGRLVADKGFGSALTAFASILPRFPNLRLTLAGDGPARGELERQIMRQRIGDRVDFTGWVAPGIVPSLINAASLVIMPSYREALPLVALEAGLMARPVVATCVGGLPEVVVHQQTGLLVENQDSRALAEAIAFLLGCPQTAIQMGQAARKRVLDIFSLRQHLDAYETLYHKLVAEWHGKNRTQHEKTVKRDIKPLRATWV